MTKDDIIRMALEAMETNKYTVAELAPHKVVMKFNDAITALREALAQPEQVDCPRCGHVCSQREWVGLTEEEKFEIAAEQHGWEDLLIAAETKLKERNK